MAKTYRVGIRNQIYVFFQGFTFVVSEKPSRSTLNVHSYPTPGDFMSYSFSFSSICQTICAAAIALSSSSCPDRCALAERKQKIKREISKSSEFYDCFTNQNSSMKKGLQKHTPFYVSHNNLEQQNFYRFLSSSFVLV